MSPVKRSYTAPRRADAARLTRRAVLDAAHQLFVERGYAATTISDIAERAGVSRPTVFAAGSKPQLLALARDLAMAGDDEQVPVAARDRFQRVLSAPSGEAALRLFAEHVEDLQSRYAALDGVLHQASGSDEACAELWRSSEEQRRAGAGMVVSTLRDLRVEPERAVDVLWVLMASEHYRRLVLEQGWTRSRYVDWLADLMVTQLIDVR